MGGIIKNPLLAIGLGVAIVLGNIAGVYDSTLMLTLLGVVGFGSLAQLRSAIESSGYKTYLISGLGAASMIAYGSGIIDQQAITVALSALLPLVAATTKHGVDKTKKAT